MRLTYLETLTIRDRTTGELIGIVGRMSVHHIKHMTSKNNLQLKRILEEVRAIKERDK